MAATPPAPPAPEPAPAPAPTEPGRTDVVAGAVPRRFLPIAGIVLALGLVILAFGYLGADEGEDGDAVGFIIITAVTLGIGYLVWRYVALPRSTGREAGTAGIIVGALSIIFALFYWTGIVYVLAPIAIALGVYAREGSEQQQGTIALVLGWIAVVGALAVGVADAIACRRAEAARGDKTPRQSVHRQGEQVQMRRISLAVAAAAAMAFTAAPAGAEEPQYCDPGPCVKDVLIQKIQDLKSDDAVDRVLWAVECAGYALGGNPCSGP